MANSIVLKAKAVNNLGEDTAFSAALALTDGTKEIAAKFSLTVSGNTIPMIGITQYGKLAGLVEIGDDTAFTVTATPIDGSAATSATTNVAAILAASIDDSLG